MYYSADVSDITAPGDPARGLPHHPSGYLPDAGLVDAVNVALILSKPLLVTGDPGTGKTQLAFSIAWQLASRGLLNVGTADVERYYTKSTSTARDLFYTFDAIRRFQARRRGDDNAAFITYNALGRAMLRALDVERVPAAVQPAVAHPAAARTVVLVDEIDKAPRDFPNDLLSEIEQMSFRIPELGNLEIGGPDAPIADGLKPIVVVTSNSEKNLPDPFLRRCIYYHIPFPSRERLEQILLLRLAQFSATKGRLVNDALQFFGQLRDGKVLQRQVSPAELIDWVTFMLTRRANLDEPLKAARALAFEGLPCLTKSVTDQPVARVELEGFLERR
jgi:MoxR-like ATPase